ncbi:TPA: hypothetical protein N2782_004507 [Vibrio parahaemolyticus]|nr:hypothetical protein [Vibrio parahaemolyticus]
MKNYMLDKYLDKEVKTNFDKWDLDTRKKLVDLLSQIEVVSMQTGKAIDSRIDSSRDQAHKLKFGLYVPGERTPPGGWIFLIETFDSGFSIILRDGKSPKFNFAKEGFPTLDKGERHIVFASTLSEFNTIHNYSQVVKHVFLPWLKRAIHSGCFRLHVRYPFCPVGINNLQNVPTMS